MKNVFSEDLLLTNKTAKKLYNLYAKNMPIVDFHCHLSPKEIYENKQFEDIGQIWLAGDHYKWRAMRVMGVDEEKVAGSASYHDKFTAYATVLPDLIGNPLYIWSALELKRYFDIDEPLCKENAEKIYQKTKALIEKKHITPRYLMEKSNVELVCTTDDPIDSLEYHKLMKADPSLKVKVLPAMRPDKAMNCEKKGFTDYIPKLEAASGIKITHFDDLLKALEVSLQKFKELGSTVSDAGLDNFIFVPADDKTLDAILKKALAGKTLTNEEISQYRTAFLLGMGRVYERNGFVMQIHIGAMRGINTAMNEHYGPDTGFDAIDNPSDIPSMTRLLDTLNSEGHLPKTIIYPLNANDQEAYAVMAAALCSGPAKGRVQLGAPWWFHDQAFGIDRQFRAVSNLYPLSAQAGMLTDSRSFLSYPRHELYRRVLCNFIGDLIERGEYFSDESKLKEIIQNICYFNAKSFFEFK